MTRFTTIKKPSFRRLSAALAMLTATMTVA